MNSLFSEFFTKFGAVFLEVCETNSGDVWEVFGGASGRFLGVHNL